MIEYNDDWRYDLKVGQDGESFIAKLLRKGNDNFTVEVKLDKAAHRTGNFFIEYESRGKDSGLKTTIADYYALMTADQNFVLLVSTEHLKNALRAWRQKCVDQQKPPERTWQKRGGDGKTSVGMLIPVGQLVQEILRSM